MVRTMSSSSTSSTERTANFSPLGWAASRGGRDFLAGPVGRQDQFDHRADMVVIFDVEPPARLLDEAEHHRQAEPGALAGLLGGEEGLGDPLDDVGGNAVAVVADREAQVAPGLEPAGSSGSTS